MHYIIVDLEASCWEGGKNRDDMEIIEIGAVKLASSRGPVLGEFDSFVRPVVHPTLSEFCTQLTGIRQADVESADLFPQVFEHFLTWAGAEPFVFCSWGGYDLRQFQRDCQRHSIPFPVSFDRHMNLKQAFSRLYRTRPLGMKAALDMLGLPLVGHHHRGIDDARNIAWLSQLILPQIEAEQTTADNPKGIP
jgi:inhibitor of KinA sporulation pathway (predicted exonuclease)